MKKSYIIALAALLIIASSYAAYSPEPKRDYKKETLAVAAQLEKTERESKALVQTMERLQQAQMKQPLTASTIVSLSEGKWTTTDVHNAFMALHYEPQNGDYTLRANGLNDLVAALVSKEQTLERWNEELTAVAKAMRPLRNDVLATTLTRAYDEQRAQLRLIEHMVNRDLSEAMIAKAWANNADDYIHDLRVLANNV